MAATLLGQGIRFLLLGFLIKKIGFEAKRIFERNIKSIAIVYAAGFVLVIFLIKVL
ncbi:MAG: hypothetical protein HC906_06965 [Bacteroidales bacterium]|nr:hypothetical protein [Bacteroidales bacterium]